MIQLTYQTSYVNMKVCFQGLVLSMRLLEAAPFPRDPVRRGRWTRFGDSESHPQGRQTLIALVEEIGLSPEVRSSLYALVPTEKGTIVFLGHVPAFLVEETLASSDLPPDLIVAQPVMTDHPSSYLWGNFQGEMEEFAIDTPLEEGLRESRSLFQTGAEPVMATITEGLAALLPSVIIAGLVDGVNPCAFAVILFLTAFLYMLRRAKRERLSLVAAFVELSWG